MIWHRALMDEFGDGSELIRAFGHAPVGPVVLVLALPDAVDEVNSEEVPSDVLMNVLRANIASTHANDDTELNLVMDVLLMGVESQGLSRRQKRGKRLVEPHGLRWQRVVQLGDVGMVVAPDADNLALVLVAKVALVQRLHSVELLVLT